MSKKINKFNPDSISFKQQQSLQPFAALLIASKKDRKVEALSSNITEFLALSTQQLLGKKLEHVFDENVFTFLNHIIKEQMVTTQTDCFELISSERKVPCFVTAYVVEESIYVEFELYHGKSDENVIFYLQNIAAEFANIHTEKALYHRTCQCINQIATFDNVFIRQFKNDGSSQVVYQKGKSIIKSWQGMQVAADELPESLETIYLERPIRYIPNVNNTTIRMIKSDSSKKYDLRRVISRIPNILDSVFNQDCQATLTLFIVVNGRIWGSIHCLKREAQLIPVQVRERLLMLIQIVAHTIATNKARASRNYKEKINQFTLKAREDAQLDENFDRLIENYYQPLKKLLKFDGLQISYEQKNRRKGILPDEKLLDHITTNISSQEQLVVTQQPELLKLSSKKSLHGVGSIVTLVIDHENSVFIHITRKTKVITQYYLQRVKAQKKLCWKAGKNLAASYWHKDHYRALYQLQQSLSDIYLRQRLRKLALQDSLTGLYNRHYLADAYQRLLAEYKRQQKKLSLVVMDIDHFKKINDTYGHISGDLVLRQIAKQLTDHFRREDIVVRYGGEEFVVVLSSAIATAKRRCEEFRQKIEKLNFKIVKKKTLHLTLSIGVAEVQVGKASQKFEQVFKQADAALYQAKENGRNQTKIAAK